MPQTLMWEVGDLIAAVGSTPEHAAGQPSKRNLRNVSEAFPTHDFCGTITQS